VLPPTTWVSGKLLALLLVGDAWYGAVDEVR
jgi:hypothetical protein